MKKNIVITGLLVYFFMFMQVLSASSLVSFHGEFKDSNVTLKINARYSSWMTRRKGKRVAGSSRSLYFKWLSDNPTVKNGRILFKNNRYNLKKVALRSHRNSLSIRLKRPEQNYFIQLKYDLGNKTITRKLIAQQGKWNSGRPCKFFIKKDSGLPFDYDGYKYVYNKTKHFFTLYDSNDTEIANIMHFDNGPDPYSSGLRRVVSTYYKKYGFINKRNIIVIKPEFDFAYPFRGQYAIVIKEPLFEKVGEHTMITKGKYGLINKSGKVVIPMKYDSIRKLSGKRFRVTLDGKKRILNLR